MAIWSRAAVEARIVVSKDEDFFDLANRPGTGPRALGAYRQLPDHRIACTLRGGVAGDSAIIHLTTPDCYSAMTTAPHPRADKQISIRHPASHHQIRKLDRNPGNLRSDQVVGSPKR